MKPIDVMRFRTTKQQSLIWAGVSTDSGSSGTFVLTFNSDGTFSGPAGTPAGWLDVTPDTTSAALYEIRWTAADGSLTETTSLTQNVWYSLGTSRSFTISGTQGLFDRTSEFYIAIRLASAGGDGTLAVWQHTIIGNA